MVGKKFLSLVLAFALTAMLVLPGRITALAANGPTTIDVKDSSGLDLPEGVTYGGNLFTIGTEANSTTITVTGTTSANTITVDSGVTGLTLNLDGASITSTTNSPIDLQGDASITLTLAEGTSNTLDAHAASNHAGIHAGSGATLTITGTGNLTAKGGAGASGVGGNSSGAGGEDGGTITISGGAQLTATGCWGGAGIGGTGNSSGGHGSGGIITIKDSATTVNATGGIYGAGIGGGGGAGGGAGGTINITGGTVNASGGQDSAGIGGAGGGGAGGYITINGGTVMATGNYRGAGIGGGFSCAGGTIKITGGSVMAIGNGGTGIGGGYNGAGGNITIDPSAIVLAVSSGPYNFDQPAIYALSGSTGSVINAKLNNAISTTDTGYLKCNGKILPLKANYRCFAFSAAAASVIGVYSDAGCTTQTHFIATKDATPSLNIPVASTIDAVPTGVQLLATSYSVGGKVSGLTNNAGITVNYTVNGSSTMSTTTDSEGNYSFAVPVAATVAITPSAQVDHVAPSAISLTNVTANSPNHDIAYTAASGSILNVGDSSGTNLPKGVTYSSNLFTIGTEANNTTIKVTGTTSANTITVATGVTGLTLILNNVTITSTQKSPIRLEGTASVALVLADSTINTLTMGGNQHFGAGIHVPHAAALTIDGSGTLTAQGRSGAGIGGDNTSTDDADGGTITINGGIINAIAGNSSGIGGKYDSAGGTITINGGTVTASSSSAPGIGGGIPRSSSKTGNIITIRGTAIVTATGGNFAAGIGGGPSAPGGTISIGGTAVVTATGGYGFDDCGGGAGIGGGRNVSGDTTDTRATLTITGTPKIMAASFKGGYGKPAIDVSGDSGKMINAGLNSAISTSATTYLKCSAKVLPLPAKYRNFAFTATLASPVKAYSDQGCNTHLGDILTDPEGFAIPVTNFSTSPSDNVAAVKLFTTDAAAVTVNRDDVAWASGTPVMKLSKSDTSLTEAITGAYSDGVTTFTGLNPATTYYVWNTTNGIYMGKSLTIDNNVDSVDYYTVTLTSGTGITSTAGAGTYLGGSDVPISADVSGSYTWSGWTQTTGGASVSTTKAYTIPNISSPISYTANAASNGLPPIITTASLPGGTVGTAYNQTLGAVTTAFPVTWSISGGSLPDNLSLNPSTGEISGTPTSAGTSTFTVKATNPNGNVTKSLTITIGNAYSLTVDLDGGNGSVADGSYAEGTIISINAGTKNGYTFSHWTSSDGGTFDDANAAFSAFTMPGHATTVTAHWTANGSTPTPGEPMISITGQPNDLTVAPNAAAEFTVSANVSTGGTVLYQWYSNTVNSKTGGTKINGATSATYHAPTNTSGVTYYYCAVSFAGAADVATDAAKLTVTKASDNSGNLDGDVDDGSSNPVAGATVKLMKNGTDGNQFGSTVTTDKDGKFQLTDIPYGSYSLVAQKGSLTVTRQITIKSKSTSEHLTMPSGAKSTKVVIQGDSTPSAAVGNLDEMFTDSDNAIAKQLGATVDITFLVQESDSPHDKGDIIAKLTKDQKVGLYLDAKLVKSINGTAADGTANIQPPSGQTLHIVLDLPTYLQGKTSYEIVRSHSENGVTNVRTISPVYDTALQTLSFDADEFSTYAVIYKESSNGGGSGGAGGGTKSTVPVDSSNPASSDLPAGSASSTVPAAPSSPASAGSPGKTTSQSASAGKESQSLPKTGEEGPWIFYGAGVVLVALGLAGIFNKGRKKQQNTEN